jgi:hypothetical protein
VSRSFGNGDDYDYTTWHGTAQGDPVQNYGFGYHQAMVFLVMDFVILRNTTTNI